MIQEQEPIEPEIVDEPIDNIDDIDNITTEKDIKESQSKKFWSWIILIAAMIYGVSPIDLLPDAPIVGWIDDFMIESAALINFIQQQFFQTNTILNKIFKIAKWILISFAVLIVLIAILIITIMVKN